MTSLAGALFSRVVGETALFSISAVPTHCRCHPIPRAEPIRVHVLDQPCRLLLMRLLVVAALKLLSLWNRGNWYLPVLRLVRFDLVTRRSVFSPSRRGLSVIYLQSLGAYVPLSLLSVTLSFKAATCVLDWSELSPMRHLLGPPPAILPVGRLGLLNACTQPIDR